jgi:hypothetical protein
MPRVVFIKNSIVVNVIEVEDKDQLPDWFVVAVDEQGNVIRKADCELYIETEVGSKDDLYEYEVGFYRQHETNVNEIEQIVNESDIEEL